MKKIYLIFTICFISIMLISCGKENYQFYRMDYNGYLDTTGYIIVEYSTKDYTTKELDSILKGINDVLLNVEKEFSIEQTYYMVKANIQESTLMKINNNSGTNNKIKVSNDFLKLLNISKDIYTKTNGLFDVTIGPLTRLWDISNKSEYCQDDSSLLEYLCQIPNEDKINEALSLINIEDVIVEGNYISLRKNGMKLDFGAIAKGFAVEKIQEYLSNYEFTYSVINMGGNVKVHGTLNQEINDLKIYVTNPFGDGNLGYYYPKTNTGGVTSGIYERYIVYKGEKYHHILNPKTGYPCSDSIVSVTIMHTDSTIADALSTSVFMLGVEEGLKLINSIDDVEVIIVTNNKQVYLSSDIEFISEVENIEIIK